MKPLWEQELFQAIAGDSLHPGGRAASAEGLQWLRAHQLLTCGQWAVDFGCGRGATLALLKQYGCRIIGLDRTRSHACPGTDIPLICADLAHLPLRSGSIDLGVCECVLSVLSDPLAGLLEIARVLAPCGACLVSDLSGEVSGQACAKASCLNGAKTLAQWQTLFQTAGFRLLHRQDHSAALRKLGAQLLWYGDKARFDFDFCGLLRQKFGYQLWLLQKE
ncbi:MAG: class I SAM-dependent methyltransferase [Desulfovibrio sp.]|nr:class I SAM-dependent methyltransferase [Desulfovibrio sp.]